MIINHKKLIKKNGWLVFMPSILCIVLMSCKTHAQVKKSNERAIDKIKSTSDKNFIEKNIVGYWEFKKLTTPTGDIIEELELQIDSLKATEKVSRPNVIFYEDKSYAIIDKKIDVIEKGRWFYDEKEKVLKFIFDKPKYNVPIDKIPSEMLNRLKKDGTIVEFKEDNWEIHQITKEKLSIIEHLPHDEYELKYNLRIYKKRK